MLKAMKDNGTSKSLADLEKELAAAIARQNTGIPTDRFAIAGRITNAQTTLATISDQVDTIRQNRQEELADGREARDLTRKIAEIQTERELQEDLIAGLKRKLAALDQEDRVLVTETIHALKRAIADLLIPPIIASYNTEAMALAETSKTLVRALTHCGQSLNTVLAPWDQDGFVRIVRLMPNGAKTEDLFNLNHFVEQERHRISSAGAEK